jgi:hypothetical protein
LQFLFFLTVPVGAQAQFTYVVTNQTVTITGYTGTIPGRLDVPNVIDGYPVTGIGRSSFVKCLDLANITIPNNVTYIGDLAFCRCENLTNVTIGTNVANIAERAFVECGKLSSLKIPASVVDIGVLAFAACPSLTTISVNTNNPVYSSVNGVLFNKNQTTLVAYPSGRSGSYSIPIGVTNIGYSSFEGCYSLTGIAMPKSITSIESNAFYYCTHLSSVAIGTNVATIGYAAFSQCPSLSSIIIPKSVISIADSAFEFCSSLTDAYFEGFPPRFGDDVFFGDNVAVYYLPNIAGWPIWINNLRVAPWLPQISDDSRSGTQTNQFGFNIAWVSGQTVVVEACTNLTNPIWLPVATNTLATGSVYFNEFQWTNYPGRFYRVRSP